MTTASDLMMNTIADTLLHVGERVMCLSEETEILKVWDKAGTTYDDNWQDFVGKKLSDVSHDALLGQIGDQVTKAITNRCDVQAEYVVIKHDHTSTYQVRAMNMQSGTAVLFLVFELQDKSTIRGMDTEAWQAAIDAVGDGMWDMNITTNKAIFSDKWHKKLGASIVDIVSIEDWSNIIHPDDYQNSLHAIQQYLEGDVTNYSSELRYKCKDGQYKWLLSRGAVVAKDNDGKPIRAIGTHTDIDERKRKEQEHLSTLQLLSTLIEKMQDALLLIDGESNILFANQAYCDMYEIQVPPNQLKGMRLQESMTSRSLMVKDPETFAERVLAIRRTRELVLNDELELKNGNIYSRDYIPITLANAEKAEIWKFKDITEQKLAQRRYEQQRLFYEKILTSIPEDIAVHDPEQRFLYLNPAAIKDDVLREWMIGKKHEDYFRYRNKPLDLADARNERFAKVINEKKSYEWEEKIIDRDGKISYHYRCLHPLFDERGAIDVVIVYGANITDRVLAENELKKSRDIFASAFNYSGIGMALLSETGNWLEVNKALCDITGYTKEELLERTFQEITYPADLEADMHLLQKLLSGELSNYTIEKRYISKSKKIVWVLLTVSFVKNNEEDPGFFVSQVVDITKRKELSDELQRKNAELEAAKISLINKVNQMDDLTHIIAHNLRGPIANIKMLSEKEDSDGAENAFEPAEAMDLIHQSSVSLIDSLNTLMEMTQIKLNKNIRADECNIQEEVAIVINQLHGTIFEENAQITLDLKVTSINYPKVYLESILYNLLSNALKYVVKGRVPEIVISTNTQNDRTTLTVKDNGIGLDMGKYGNDVFKLNKTFHRGYDSRGVGLFITKTQIESLGGRIDVKSTLNEGSEFIVTF